MEGNTTLCNRTVAETHLIGDSASSVEFFVGVAVLAFLYCMLALLVYLGYMHVYKDSNFGPTLVSATSEGFLCLECDQLCNPRFLGMIYDWQVFSPPSLSFSLSVLLALFASLSLFCHLPCSLAPLQDFVVTAAFAFLWLVCSSAWARGLQVVKDATGPAGIDSTLSLCREPDVHCEVSEMANMRSLDISVVSSVCFLFLPQAFYVVN